MVKNLPAMHETQVQSLCWEDPLEKGIATYSNILAWRTPWTEEPGELQSMGSQTVGHNWATNTHTQTLFCLEHLGTPCRKLEGEVQWRPQTMASQHHSTKDLLQRKYCPPAESTEAHLARGSLKPQIVYFLNYKQRIYENKMLLE